MRVVVGLFALMVVIAIEVGAQPSPVRLDRESLQSLPDVDLSPSFVYTTRDDARFSQMIVDDAAWAPVLQADRMQGYTLVDWKGIGWLRGGFTLSSNVKYQSLSLVVAQFGASEIYIDGVLVRKLGEVSTVHDSAISFNPQRQIIPIDPFVDRSDTARVHVIAIRLQAEDMSESVGSDSAVVGFGIHVGRTDTLAHSIAEHIDTFDRTTLVPFGMVLSLGLLHFLFFLFDKKQRVHLIYTFFALNFAGIFVSWHLIVSSTDPTTLLIIARVLGILWIVIIWVVLLLIAMMFYGTLTKKRLLYSTAIMLVTLAISFLVPGYGTSAWAGFVLIATIDVSRLTIKAMRQRMAGAWIIGIGLLVFTCYTLTWFAGQFLELMQLSDFMWRAVTVSGLISMPVSMSIFLARRVGELSDARLAQERRATEEEILRKQFEAENARQSNELEEARRLQESMRPANMTPLNQLETAVAMQSATEVGGDYFDYIRHSDDRLTVAIGDATGHGMKASVLVTATKCHFLMYAATEDHPTIMRKTSEGLRKLNMRGMYMCMGLLTIDGMKATFTSAGIPPLLHYRISTGDVVRYTVKALPLGSPMIPSYDSITADLQPGDVLVLLTDGLPELFNNDRQTPGYESIERIVIDHASRTALEIGNELVLMSERWLNGHEASDDITFAVIKVV